MNILKEIILPQESVNDEEVLIVSCFFKNGDRVSSGDKVLECESSKAVFTVESEYDGYIVYLCSEGDNVKVGSVIGYIFNKWDALQADKIMKKGDKIDTAISITPNTKPEVETYYSRHAESMMSRHSIGKDIFSGKDFVSVFDVEKYLETKQANQKDRNIQVSRHQVSRDPQNRDSSLTTSIPNKRDARKTKDRERVVVVCANNIASEVIKDILENQEEQIIVGYVVDDQYKATSPSPLLNANVFDFPSKIDRSDYDTVILAMGGSLRSMRFRKAVFDHYQSCGVPFTNVISVSANIASNVHIGKGNIIESNVYIGTGSTIGDNNFISYATVIGHHNIVGSCNLFAPGVMMAGLVTIGDDCILPTGVNFIDRVKIGSRVILPVGYNVVSDLGDDTVVKNRT